jgi:hypothetical protein
MLDINRYVIKVWQHLLNDFRVRAVRIQFDSISLSFGRFSDVKKQLRMKCRLSTGDCHSCDKLAPANQ